MLALFGQLLAHHFALERREIIHEQLAVQVVHLVLDAHGQQPVGTFQQPCVGAASTAFGKINPYATTTIRSASSARNVANASGERSVCGWKTGMPRAIASSLTGEGVNPRPRPAGRSGCVYTATTSCRCAAARSDGTAKSGVPAKMILIGLGFGIREWGVATAGVLAGARMAWS